MKRWFPADQLSRLDYVIASVFVALCSALFLHPDLMGTGLVSLNFSFGEPLDLYENCKRIPDCWTPYARPLYLPPTFVIDALWLYPFKLLGLLTTQAELPLYLAYWLKALTTALYIGSGVVFYKICLEFGGGLAWARYATAAYLTAPIALLSQSVISQNDIFHVSLTLAAFLMILRKRLLWASVLFGLSITFKYFPTFIFVPLLLLHEKRTSRIALLGCVFVTPLLLLNILYADSPAFIEAVRGNSAMYRVLAASLDVGGALGWQVYGVVAVFGLLCATAYFTDVTPENRCKVSAFYWLVGSILPFLFMAWLPYWLLTIVPATVLTTMLSRHPDRHFRLDLVGMLVFVAAMSMGLQNDSDAAMFRGEWLGVEFDNSYLMSRLFRWFGIFSANVYVSLFWAYLVLQIILKLNLALRPAIEYQGSGLHYGVIRQRLYLGLSIFLVPALFSVYQDQRSNELTVQNPGRLEQVPGRVAMGRRFEQSFLAGGTVLKRVSLFLTPAGRPTGGLVALEIVDETDSTLGRAEASAEDFNESAWQEFRFDAGLRVEIGAQYRIRLTCAADPAEDAFPSCATGDGVVWIGSSRDTYPGGRAIIDGSPKDFDFSFRVAFGSS